MIPEFHPAKNFTPDLTKGETILGWIYLPIHVIVLPLLLGLLPLLWADCPLTESGINILYYAVGLIFMALFFRKYLRREFDRLCDHLIGCMASFSMAFLLWYILMMALQLVLMALGLEIEDNPNNTAINEIAQTDLGPTMVMGIFLAPIVEEILFRGVVFQSIRKKHRVLAYVVSIGLFALYHIWQYALVEGDPWVLLYAVQYVPITLAITWAYERSGSLWTAIFFHMFNNTLPFLLTMARI